VSDFLINTDYTFDKILGWWSGSFTASARYALFDPRASQSSFAHEAGSYGLIVGAWSTNNIDWLPFGVVPADTSGSQPNFQYIECSAYCTDSNIVVMATNWTTSAFTIYYALQLLAVE